MVVAKLLVEEYGEDGRTEESRWLLDPSWEQAENSVKALDRFRRPFVWFYVNRDAADDAVAEFEVVGGDGAYVMVGNQPDGSRLVYLDDSRGGEPVAVWTSDQGADVEAKHVCQDLATVLRTLQFFCDHGRLDPRVTWGRD